MMRASPQTRSSAIRSSRATAQLVRLPKQQPCWRPPSGWWWSWGRCPVQASSKTRMSPLPHDSEHAAGQLVRQEGNEHAIVAGRQEVGLWERG
eukprot:4834685-Alexandrium_andersonii.AAC.1